MNPLQRRTRIFIGFFVLFLGFSFTLSCSTLEANAASPVEQRLLSKDPNVQLAAVQELSKAPDEEQRRIAQIMVNESLDHGTFEARNVFIYPFMSRHLDIALIPRLISKLGADDPGVNGAIDLLKQMPAAVPALIETLASRNSRAKEQALSILTEIAGAPQTRQLVKNGLPRILAAYEGTSGERRRMFVLLLERIDSPDSAAAVKREQDKSQLFSAALQ